MILEVAMLNVRKGMESEFEVAFAKASPIIASTRGYISHELQRCIEVPNQYLLLVRWQTLEDHTTGFRQSPEYDEWKQLLHHFYNSFPTVEHFEGVLQYHCS
ncbi:MAG: antibiotic biosynthesis monooxygenase [Scytonema sp. RU_4_4]|nr:antibiotic biosynthesis monooxygenase [Scytonema sp. RU_4_4]